MKLIKALSPWVLAGLLTACGNYVHEKDQSDTNLIQATFSSIQQNILQPVCLTCHSGNGEAGPNLNFSSYSSLLASGTVVAGNPQASTLYTALQSGAMPLGGSPLPANEVQAVFTWIQNGASETSAPTPTPSPSPSPSPSASPTSTPPSATATYAEVNQQIIEPHCISCHSGSGSAGTKLNFSSYDSLIAASVVTAGNAGASSLYLQTNSGAMPLGGPALSAQQVQLIEQWIQNGATDD